MRGVLATSLAALLLATTPTRAEEPALPDEPAETEEAAPAPQAPWWTWTLVGTGVAMASVGVGMNIWAASIHDDLLRDYPDGTEAHPQPTTNRLLYDKGFDEDVQPRLFAAYALYAFGGALVLTGVASMVIETTVCPGEAPAVEQAWTPWASPTGAGIGYHARF